MKILIADDELGRYRRLMPRLKALGVQEADIDTAVSSGQAQEMMEAHQYDLLVLDIVIPLRPQGDGDPQNALDLLFTVHASEMVKRPRHIVGITADDAAAERAGEDFAALTWAIVRYSHTDDSWMTRILAFVDYVGAAGVEVPASAEAGADVVIACALQTPELDQVLALPWNWDPKPTVLPDATFVHRGWFMDAARKRYTVAAAHAPRMGMVSSALLSASLIQHLRPRLIAMTGICAGVRGKAALGDVLLADPSWDFQSGKRIRNGDASSLSSRAHQLAAPDRVRKLLQELQRERTGVQALCDTFGTTRPNDAGIKVGPVACGSAVLADGLSIGEIKSRQQDDVIGVEMEIYGVYAAARAAAEPQPLAFALKGVCDFADPEKGDDAQDYAAFMSAGVLRLLLETHGSLLMP